ncbi:MAG TPA: hypothetical protein VHG91_18840 [Longimicrobium sp.]|nr:hypothetical protein [Longimicrobium sp.]
MSDPKIFQNVADEQGPQTVKGEELSHDELEDVSGGTNSCTIINYGCKPV